MSKEFSRHIDEDFLAKHFAGECSRDEENSLLDWRNQSSENEEIYQRSYLIWNDLGALKSPDNEKVLVDVDESWEEWKKANIKTRSLSFWKVAAAVILGVAMIGYILSTFEESSPIRVQASTDNFKEQLSDGSIITLKESSTISYEEGTREVKLTGSAFFDVSHDKSSPFIVRTEEVEIVVLGTEFFVSTDSEKNISVSVVSGKVEVRSASKTLLLSAGENANFNSLEKDLTKQTGENEDQQLTYWYSKSLTYNGAGIEEIVDDLSAIYNISIVLNGDFTNCNLTTRFQNNSLEEVMEILEVTWNVEIKFDQDEIVITGEGCD